VTLLGDAWTYGVGATARRGDAVRAAATGADVIVVQGRLDERNSTREALIPAGVQTLARLRAEAELIADRPRRLLLDEPDD
jgi:4-hydroxy-3-methylbut-2-enyl diphosphate reductase IspH